MAREQTISELHARVEELKKTNIDVVIKRSLGSASLEELLSVFEEIKHKLDFYIANNKYVPENILVTLRDNLTTFIAKLVNYGNFDEPSFFQNRESIRRSVIQFLEQLYNLDSHFITSAIQQSNLLGGLEQLENDRKKIISEIEGFGRKYRDEIVKQSEDIISRATQVAEEIKESARKTARGISVEAAQEQFKQGQKEQKTQIIIWATIALIFTIVFAVTANFFFQQEPTDKEAWKVFYKLTIRAGILGLLLVMIGFSLRMLKAHLHMYQYNLHRQKITNSVAAFVESANTHEQQDIILGKMVDAVCTFGSTGILNKESSSTPTISFDSISKTFTQGK